MMQKHTYESAQHRERVGKFSHLGSLCLRSIGDEGAWVEAHSWIFVGYRVLVALGIGKVVIAPLCVLGLQF